MNVWRVMGRIGAAAPVLFVAVSAAAQAPPAGQQGAAAPKAAPPATGAVECPAPPPPATLPERSFTGPVGILLFPVPTEKVADFERFLGYFREALDSATDPVVREQAKGWRFLRDTSTQGPNGDVIYVFLLDPVVPCVDYSVARILSAAIPDPAKLKEVWSLYALSPRTPGSLMNLVPAGQPADSPSAPTEPAAQTPTQTPAPVLPLDANPNRPPT